MKKFLFIILASIGSMAANAQKVTVKEITQEVENVDCQGMSTTIELDHKTVEKAWARKVKEFGKTITSRDNYIVNVALIPEISPNAVKVFSRVRNDNKGTTVFFAIDLGDGFLTPAKPEYGIAKKILHDFAVTVYRDDMNEQIKEAERAVMLTVKSHEKKTSEGENLKNKLERNEAEKKKLERELIENAEEHKQLLKDIEQNKQQLEATLEEIGKVRKLAEVKKNKLAEIQ